MMKRIYFALCLVLLAAGPLQSIDAETEANAQEEWYHAEHCHQRSTQRGLLSEDWFGGIEYRFIRPSFSEAVAFAVVTDSFAGGFQRRVAAQELEFDYDSSAKFYLGLRIGDCQDFRVSYWNLNMDVNVNGAANAGQTIVDPFGNLGGAGSTIGTNASVQMNVFDVEYLQALNFPAQDVNLVYSAGLRFADVNQAYDSTIRNAANVVTSAGVFTADFEGLGPYFSLAGSNSHNDRFALMAKGGAGVLIGSYAVASGVTIPGVAVGGQSADRVRAVPVLEGELSALFRPTDRFTLSAGWLVQAWFDLGTSGGTFDGENLPVAPIDTVFGQTDDADIMSFDGLFVRGELWF